MGKEEIIQHAQVMSSVIILTRRLSTPAQINDPNSIVAAGLWGVRRGAVD